VHLVFHALPERQVRALKRVRYLVGVGNYLAGDDGVGPRVIEYVVANGLDRGFVAVDLSTDALSLVAYLDADTEAVLVVDAARVELAPGDFRFFSPDEVETQKELTGLTTHEADVLKVLELAREAGYPIPRFAIMGIEPSGMGGGMALSACLAERLPQYAAAAIDHLSEL
jgi:hydrogenase maturation protease